MGESLVRRLTAGGLSVDLVGDQLRHWSWRGVAWLDRLYLAFRLVGWTTAEHEAVSVDVAQGTSGFMVACAGRAAGLDLSWAYRVHATADETAATVQAELSVLADGDVPFDRIGWNLWHPLSVIGGRASFGLGEADASVRIDERIASQAKGADGRLHPCWGPFDQLVIDGGGVCARWRFTGTTFETEDQRNWTDANLKTYAMSLAAGTPTPLRAGSVLEQGFTIEVREGSAHRSLVRSPRSPGRPTRWTALAQPGVTAADVQALVDGGAATGLRIEMMAGSLEGRSRSGASTARLSSDVLPFVTEVVVWADETTDWRGVAGTVGPLAPEVVLVMTPEEVTSALLLDRARAALPGLVVAGGTRRTLAELNRNDITHLRGAPVGFAISPAVHASDREAMLGTVASHAAVVSTARDLVGASPLLIGPITGALRGFGVEIGPVDEWDGAAVVPSLVASLASLDVDGVCTVGVRDLAVNGRLTILGRQVAAAIRDAG